MIKPESFSREWIESFRNREGYSRIDLMVLEKMIRALSLVELLKIHDVEFVFKGGTSLTLLLDVPQRFSIDIDILTTEEKLALEEKLGILNEDSNFTRFEENVRGTQGTDIQKAHYKFYYTSAINNRENYILLDVLFEESLYPELIECDVNNIFLDIEEEFVRVLIPSIESITGDKLTAFAPNTIGILYGINKSQEIIKQLFDISKLYDELTNFETVSNSYRGIASKEIEYRQLDKTIEDTLDDTIETGLLIARRDRNLGDDLTKYRELIDGIREFSSFSIDRTFILDSAIEASAKAALIAAKIKVENFDQIESFNIDKGILAYLIEDTAYNFLNRLRRLPNRSLYYWYHTIQLITR